MESNYEKANLVTQLLYEAIKCHTSETLSTCITHVEKIVILLGKVHYTQSRGLYGALLALLALYKFSEKSLQRPKRNKSTLFRSLSKRTSTQKTSSSTGTNASVEKNPSASLGSGNNAFPRFQSNESSKEESNNATKESPIDKSQIKKVV